MTKVRIPREMWEYMLDQVDPASPLGLTFRQTGEYAHTTWAKWEVAEDEENEDDDSGA